MMRRNVPIFQHHIVISHKLFKLSRSFSNLVQKSSPEQPIVWSDLTYQKFYLEQLAKKLNINTLDDWYKIGHQDFINNGGRSLLSRYEKSHIKAITTLLPEHDWKRWRFKNCPTEFWKDPINQKDFMNDLGKKLGFKEWKDWYSISPEAIFEHGGQGLLTLHKDYIQVIKNTFPEHPWITWKFRRVPDGYWKNFDNQRMVLDSIAKELNMKQFSDWYLLSPQIISDHGGKSLLNYHGSMFKMLSTVYKEFKWVEDEFLKKKFIDYWYEKQKRLEFLESCSKVLKIKNLDDWYRISETTIKKLGGSKLLELYEESLYKLLKYSYENQNWKFWRFPKIPPGLWKNLENRQAFLDEFSVGFKSLDDWYLVDPKSIVQSGGEGLLHHFGGSLARAVMNAYPGHKWKRWKFKEISVEYWEDRDNRKEFFEDLRKILNFSHWQDWYRVNSNEISEKGGSTLLRRYNDSYIDALIDTYPEFSWNPDRFGKAPVNHWKDKNNQRAFFDKLWKEMNIQSWEDWYQIKINDVKRRGASGILAYYDGSLMQTLVSLYPEISWENSKHWKWNNAISGKTSKSQNQLFQVLKEIIPNDGEMFIDFILKPKGTDRRVELDIYIPSLSLAFEYQGGQHYEVGLMTNDLQKRQSLDFEKSEICKKEGITLIQVPYTWDGSKNELLKYFPNK